MTHRHPLASPRAAARYGRIMVAFSVSALTACATMDALTSGASQRRPATLASPSGTGAASRSPATERPGAPGSPMEYSPAPGRQAASGAAGARTKSEKQLAEDSENFKDVVFGGFLKTMLTVGLPNTIVCIERFLPYLTSNKSKGSKDFGKTRMLGCGATVLVNTSIGGVGEGYRTAKLQEAGRDRLRAVESVTEDMEADNAKLRNMVQASEEILKESEGRLKQLRTDVSQRKTRTDEARRATEQDRANVAALERAINDARVARDTYQKTAQQMPSESARSSELDGEIRKMNQQIARLEANLKQLQSAMLPFAA